MGETNRCMARTGLGPTFSILERIDVGETNDHLSLSRSGRTLSVSSNGSTWVKHVGGPALDTEEALSVSSNGSTWVKLIC